MTDLIERLKLLGDGQLEYLDAASEAAKCIAELEAWVAELQSSLALSHIARSRLMDKWNASLDDRAALGEK